MASLEETVPLPSSPLRSDQAAMYVAKTRGGVKYCVVPPAARPGDRALLLTLGRRASLRLAWKIVLHVIGL